MPVPSLVWDVTTAELSSSPLKGPSSGHHNKEGDRDVIGWRYLRSYWSQIKPSQSRNSNTINECGVRRETGDCPHAPSLTPIAWEWVGLTSALQWLVTTPGTRSDTWHVTWCHGECQVAQTNIGLLIARAIAAWLLVFAQPPAHRSGSMANGVFVLLSDIQILALPAQVHKYVDNIQIYDQ